MLSKASLLGPVGGRTTAGDVGGRGGGGGGRSMIGGPFGTVVLGIGFLGDVVSKVSGAGVVVTGVCGEKTTLSRHRSFNVGHHKAPSRMPSACHLSVSSPFS